ncbi:MAG: aminotransferase class I/II-fold pyridoxal phosphate-dependent enzyme [Vampirovibrionales bacterium]|nr:aminotransferase class I/II-fold pyridoxal phosphate-dependent enzyme [Vampirovibrionales bacterium]
MTSISSDASLTSISPESLIQPRQAVLALSAYKPPLEGRTGKIRLDFNENTAGLAELMPEALRPLGEAFGIYPEYEALTQQMAAQYALPGAEWLLLTNGSDEGLSVLASTFIEPKQDVALICQPTFPMIPHSLKLAEAKLLEIPLTPEFQFDLSAIEQALSSQPVKLVMLASPDNPTGAELAPETLVRWLKQFPQTLFIMDEAYAGFSREKDSYREGARGRERPTANEQTLSLLTQSQNLIISRSFSKVWALAGLRLGILMGQPYLMNYLSRVRSPYSVNVAAVAVAQTMLTHTNAVSQSARGIMARKPAFIQAIQARGWRTSSGGGNFFLLAAGRQLPQLLAACKQAGVLIRSQDEKPMLKGWARVTVGTDAENQAFLAVLDSLRQQQALILDLDDTLVDCSESFTAVVHALYAHYSGQPLALDTLQTLRAEGGYNDDWVTTLELLKRAGLKTPTLGGSSTLGAAEKPLPSLTEIAKEGVRRYLDVAPKTECLLVADATLKALAKRFRLMIYTGRHRPEYDPVWRERLQALIEDVLCVDELPSGMQPKPAPDGLNVLMQRHGLTGGYYAGNNIDDMQAATGAALIAIGVTTTQPEAVLVGAGAAWCVSTLEQLRDDFLLP